MTTGSASRTAQVSGWVARQRWTLERFGTSPAKLPRRLSNPSAPRVFCVSIPKSGTHLLERALCLHPALYRKLIPTVSDENIGRWRNLESLAGRIRPGQVVMSHLRYKPTYPETLARRGVKGIFMVRNPRDIVVSQVFYVSKRTDHRWHGVFGALPDLNAKLRLAISGDPAQNLPSIGERLRYFESWLECGFSVVHFEDLIGPQGGGDAAHQLEALRSAFEHLGVEASEIRLASVRDRLFSADSPTFRRGSIGESRELFDDELEELFQTSVGERAAPYGYSV